MNGNEKVLTISVAAYNLGDMIRKNLESFVCSKYIDKLEVIVTNDGSKDDTKEIIEEYSKEYKGSIVLIDKKNEGAGSTVNSGIKYATGRYFKMVDGDDWVNTKELDNLIENLIYSDADMVLTNYSVFSSEENKIIKYDRLNLRENVQLDFKSIFHSNIYMYNITYKTKILRENNIILDNGFYTDQEYILFPLPYVHNIVYFNLDVYVYLVGREGQSMSINSLKKHIDMHELVAINLTKFFEKNKWGLSDDTKRFIVSRIINLLHTHLCILLSEEENSKLKQNIKSFNIKIRNESKQIYSSYKKIKKSGLIIYSNYFLTRTVAKSFQRKLDLLKNWERE